VGLFLFLLTLIIKHDKMNENLKQTLIITLKQKKEPLLIAGPCAVQTEHQIRTTALGLANLGTHIIRTALWKPRTSPDNFQGVGEIGLDWLVKVKNDTSLPIATEITHARQLEITRGIVDLLWIGARNMANYELLKEVGLDGRPVILKRGMSATKTEWIGAGHYIGKNLVALCERGLTPGSAATRNVSDLGTALIVKKETKIPIIFDPSHIAGDHTLVPHLAIAAISAGLDGLIVEVTHHPKGAMTDQNQQISIRTFEKITKYARQAFDLNKLMTTELLR
jgi:3-deoxy-7-phosphoheptulonate synthase